MGCDSHTTFIFLARILEFLNKVFLCLMKDRTPFDCHIVFELQVCFNGRSTFVFSRRVFYSS